MDARDTGVSPTGRAGMVLGLLIALLAGTLLLAVPASAATTRTAALTSTGLTPGGSTLHAHPGDTVVLTASHALLQVTADLSSLPGGSDGVLSGGTSRTFRLTSTGTFAISWSVQRAVESVVKVGLISKTVTTVTTVARCSATIVVTTVSTTPVQAAAPKAGVPKATTPKVTVPKVTVPKVTVPKVTVPKVTVPKVTVPKVTVPKVTGPKVTVPGVGTPAGSSTPVGAGPATSATSAAPATATTAAAAPITSTSSTTSSTMSSTTSSSAAAGTGTGAGLPGAAVNGGTRIYTGGIPGMSDDGSLTMTGATATGGTALAGTAPAGTAAQARNIAISEPMMRQLPAILALAAILMLALVTAGYIRLVAVRREVR